MAEELSFPALPVSAGGGRVLAAPFQFLLTGDDRLRIVAVNSQTGVVLALQGYRLDLKGTKHELARAHTPTTDRTVTTEDYTIGAGALLNLTVFASAGAPRIGQTYVMLQLVRGAGAAAIVMGTLLAGYVTSRQALGWPGSAIESSISGGGVIRTVVGTDPAAGAEIAETVPTGARWQLLAIEAQLTADATVANRRPFVILDTGTVNLMQSPASATTGASGVDRYFWAVGMPLATVISGAHPLAGLPTDCPMLAGQRIFIQCDNLQAGDNFGAPVLQVREWLEVDA